MSEGAKTLSETITLAPNPVNKCFGCGGDNAGGMKLTFEQDNVNRRIVGRFALGERYQGGGGLEADQRTAGNYCRRARDGAEGKKHFYDRRDSRYGRHGAGEGQSAFC